MVIKIQINLLEGNTSVYRVGKESPIRLLKNGARFILCKTEVMWKYD